MKNIVKAIEVENEYLQYRMKGEEPFHLIDKLKEYGFSSLNDFEEEKKYYKFTEDTFTFIETSPMSGVVECIQLMSKQKPFVAFGNVDTSFVYSGSGEVNTEYCAQKNITVVPIHTAGGTIVSTSGDFAFCLCCKEDIIKNIYYILNNIAKLLQKYTEKEVTVEGNDILVDGKKVCGSASYKLNKYLMFAGYFSFSEKDDLISKICTTKKIGKPVGYIDFISREEFREEVKQWLQIK